MTSRQAGTVVLLVLVLLSLPVASAVDLAIEVPESDSAHRVTRGAAATIPVVFAVEILVDQTVEAYVRAATGASNPVYQNGTINQTGWWSAFALVSGEDVRATGATNGMDAVDLGTLEAGANHTLHVTIHVPPNATLDLWNYRPTYIVVVHSPAGNESSGTSISPSEAFAVTIQVVDSAAPDDDNSKARNIPTPTFAASLASFAGAAYLVYPRRRKAEVDA